MFDLFSVEAEEQEPAVDENRNEESEVNERATSVDYEALAVPGPSGESTTRNAGIIHTVDTSDDDSAVAPQHHSTPRQSQHLSGPNTIAAAADRVARTIYDAIEKVPMVCMASNGLTSWQRDAVEVGEIHENENLLYGAEIDSTSGPAHDLRIMEQLLVMHQIPQRLPFLCLSPVQVRLQSHADVIPACIIRYRPTKEAVEYLSMWD